MQLPQRQTLVRILYPLLFLSLALRFIMSQTEPVTLTQQISPLTPNRNVAVFAAYSADGTVSDYVVDYLKKLKAVAPNIIYITDNPIKKSALNKIKPYVNYIEAVRHGEYDWGSYKRGLQALPKNASFDKLILANDSALPVADSFAPILSAMPQTADLFGITANQDGTYHLQSYFLVLNKSAWQSPAFQNYLNAVQKQADGLTVAYRYEVPFTEYMEKNGFKSASYISYDSLSHLPLNDKNCYPLTLLSTYHAPFLKMRTFTDRLNVEEPRRLVFRWLQKNSPTAYKNLIAHLKHINSPYLKENR